MPKAKPIRLLVVLSDLHAGSTYAVLPPGFVTLEGNEVQQNAVQRWLWECWTDAMERWLPGIVGSDRYAVAINGDVIEGVHHKTKEIISPELIDHHDAAKQILAPLTNRAAATYITEGTEAHSGNVEHTLARALRAVPDPNTGRPAWGRLDLTIAGTRVIVQHHISVAIRTYLEASGLGIALGSEQLEAAKNGERVPRVLCCAHRHRYGEFTDASGLCVVTPPWQALTRYGRKFCPSSRTRPGLVVLDWRNRKDGEIPETHAKVYETPQPKGATL